MRPLKRNTSGMTLVELLVSLSILGIIMLGLNQAVETSLSAFSETKSKQELLAQARYAMERMVMFVQESDLISDPSTIDVSETLRVSERVLDTYNNVSGTYAVDGDGLLDADTDADGLVNQGGTDPADLIRFFLEKNSPADWKLKEEMPDYSTSVLGDFKPATILCENISAFNCRRLSSKMVEIELSVSDGTNEVTLTTRTIARYAN